MINKKCFGIVLGALGLVLSITIAAPESASASELASAPAVSGQMPTNEEPSLRECAPRNQPEQSGKIYKALRSSGFRPIVVDGGKIRILRAYDITCANTAETATRCTFADRPSGKAGVRSRTFVLGPKASEDLADVLYNLPVPMGESGVSTSFIDCWKGKDWADCSVAVKVDYQGP